MISRKLEKMTVLFCVGAILICPHHVAAYADTAAHTAESGTAVYAVKTGTAAHTAKAGTAVYAVKTGTAAHTAKADRAAYAVKTDTAAHTAKAGTAAAANTGASAKGQQEEAEAFIREFYKALIEGDFDKMREHMDGSDESEEYITRCRALLAYGMQSYEVTAINVYPMKDKDSFLVVKAYEVCFEGIDVGLPGAEVELLQKRDDGNWMIIADYESSALYEEMLQMLTNDVRIKGEIDELMEEQNLKLYEIEQESPEIAAWLWELTDKLTYYLAEDETVYIVKEGDCLWSIAERELGDGMRWSSLYEANKEAIGGNPDLILVGMRLQLKKIQP